ncbi:hypothetical protein O181_082654 [Austropuccinia psidii MF-1]|uniref:Uncharacterized protein n=1 Tax=Austropuccinia psidii MF-1 TaxID=1389203 RepID=A0A9Q3FPP1_9BASI|nr:hypothetical protein [Austropuccinia psidii MF-1]
MDINLEMNMRYGEREKEKGSHQEKKPPVAGTNSFMTPQNSSFKMSHHQKSKKGNNFQVSKDKPHPSPLNKDNKLIGFEKEAKITKGLCPYCCGKHLI